MYKCLVQYLHYIKIHRKNTLRQKLRKGGSPTFCYFLQGKLPREVDNILFSPMQEKNHWPDAAARYQLSTACTDVLTPLFLGAVFPPVLFFFLYMHIYFVYAWWRGDRTTVLRSPYFGHLWIPKPR